jgi:predicted RNase H-like HicB family nuclease
LKFYSFEIVIEKEPEDEGYFAYCPALSGCFSNGLTIEETKSNIREAIQLHLESLRAHNQEIPQKDTVVHVEEISIGLPE